MDRLRIAPLLCIAFFSAPARAEGPPALASIAGTVDAPLPAHAVVWLESPNLPAPAPPTGEVKITPRGDHIEPPLSVVVVGQTVTFPQVDAILHDLYAFSRPKTFRLGSYTRGHSKKVLFDKPGIVEIFCHLHEGSHASLAVMPSATYQVLDASGRYAFTGLRPGLYLLRAFSPDGGTIVLREKLDPGASVTQPLHFPRHDPPEEPPRPRPPSDTPPQFLQLGPRK